MTTNGPRGDALRNLTWLPRWETKIKPWRSRTFTTCRDENNLGMLKLAYNNARRIDARQTQGSILKIKRDGFFQVFQCFRLIFSEARYVNIQTLGNIMLPLFPNYRCKNFF